MKDSRSILLFSFDYPPATGGISRLCAQLSEELQKLTHLEVLTRKESSGDPGAIIPPVPTTRVTGCRPWMELTALWKLIWGFTDKDTVVCDIWYPEGLIALISRMFRKRQLVVMAHGNELFIGGSGPKQAILATLRRIVLSHCDLIVANSQYTLNLVRKARGTAPGVAIPLAVDSKRFTPRIGDLREFQHLKLNGKRIILTVSRLEAYKGFTTVFKALADIPDRGTYLYLIAGTGPYRQELEKQTESLEISEQVKFLGYVPEDDLPNLYAMSHLFVLCTEELPDQRAVEGFGLVLLEAQASGVPVIATRAGGMPEAMVEGETGWLIDQGDYKSLRTLLVELFDHSGNLSAAGASARTWTANECRWDLYAKKFWDALRNMH